MTQLLTLGVSFPVSQSVDQLALKIHWVRTYWQSQHTNYIEITQSVMPKPVYLMTVQEAHKQYGSLMDQIRANLLAHVSQLYQIGRGPTLDEAATDADGVSKVQGLAMWCFDVGWSYGEIWKCHFWIEKVNTRLLFWSDTNWSIWKGTGSFLWIMIRHVFHSQY